MVALAQQGRPAFLDLLPILSSIELECLLQ